MQDPNLSIREERGVLTRLLPRVRLRLVPGINTGERMPTRLGPYIVIGVYVVSIGSPMGVISMNLEDFTFLVVCSCLILALIRINKALPKRMERS